MVRFIGNGKQQRPFIRGRHGKALRLAHLERDPRKPASSRTDGIQDVARRADELSQPASCGYLPPSGWPHEYARDGHRDTCDTCASIEADDADRNDSNYPDDLNYPPDR